MNVRHKIDTGQSDEHAECAALADILSRIGDKWTIFVVGLLSTGPKRFSELKRAVGPISHRMLTITVRALERDGLVTRTVTPSIPPRVDYELTDVGKSLIVPVSQLSAWATLHREHIARSRQEFDDRPNGG